MSAGFAEDGSEPNLLGHQLIHLFDRGIQGSAGYLRGLAFYCRQSSTAPIRRSSSHLLGHSVLKLYNSALVSVSLIVVIRRAHHERTFAVARMSDLGFYVDDH